jgi:tetratricopeptide (TPR) repeat protein
MVLAPVCDSAVQARITNWCQRENAAALNEQMNDEAKAEQFYKEAIQLYQDQLGMEEHLDHARAINNLARLYDRQGRYEEAEPLYQQALKIRQQHLDVLEK